MGKYRKLPVEIEAISFEEFVKYGLNDSEANIVNGEPWHFKYKGHAVTQENSQLYLIPTLEGVHNFTPQDVLITGIKGEIYPCKKDIFEATYKEVSSDNLTFGEALEALKEWKLISRKGWNGKGMFIVKQIPSTIGLEIIPKMQSLPQSVKDVLIQRNQPINYQSQMLIINSEGKADSWVPSSSDCFAEDWIVVE